MRFVFVGKTARSIEVNRHCPGFCNFCFPRCGAKALVGWGRKIKHFWLLTGTFSVALLPKIIKIGSSRQSYSRTGQSSDIFRHGVQFSIPTTSSSESLYCGVWRDRATPCGRAGVKINVLHAAILSTTLVTMIETQQVDTTSMRTTCETQLEQS